MADDITAGWRLDRRVVEEVRALAEQQGRTVQGQAERLLRAALTMTETERETRLAGEVTP